MNSVSIVKVLTGAFMQNVVERAVRHPMCDDDRVRGRRQTRTQNREHIRMGKYPEMEPEGKVGIPGGHQTHGGFDRNRQLVWDATTKENRNFALPQRKRQQTMGRQGRTHDTWIKVGGGDDYLSLGYSSLKSRVFLVVQSRTFSSLATMSFPCQRPCQSFPRGEINQKILFKKKKKKDNEKQPWAALQ